MSQILKLKKNGYRFVVDNSGDITALDGIIQELN